MKLKFILVFIILFSNIFSLQAASLEEQRNEFRFILRSVSTRLQRVAQGRLEQEGPAQFGGTMGDVLSKQMNEFAQSPDWDPQFVQEVISSIYECIWVLNREEITPEIAAILSQYLDAFRLLYPNLNYTRIRLLVDEFKPEPSENANFFEKPMSFLTLIKEIEKGDHDGNSPQQVMIAARASGPLEVTKMTGKREVFESRSFSIAFQIYRDAKTGMYGIIPETAELQIHTNGRPASGERFELPPQLVQQGLQNGTEGPLQNNHPLNPKTYSYKDGLLKIRYVTPLYNGNNSDPFENSVVEVTLEVDPHFKNFKSARYVHFYEVLRNKKVIDKRSVSDVQTMTPFTLARYFRNYNPTEQVTKMYKLNDGVTTMPFTDQENITSFNRDLFKFMCQDLFGG